MNSISRDKNEIRKKMLGMRNSLNSSVKATFDISICEQLKSLIIDREIRILHSFIPIKTEINVKPVLDLGLDRGMRIYCPKTEKNRKLSHHRLNNLSDLIREDFGTFYPNSNEDYNGSFDMILVPGLAFDSEGNRLGYGGGFYDTFLAQHDEAIKIGLAYPFQVLSEIPTNQHDVKVDIVLCPSSP